MIEPIELNEEKIELFSDKFIRPYKKLYCDEYHGHDKSCFLYENEFDSIADELLRRYYELKYIKEELKKYCD